jgi:hypothetical protein
MLINDMLLKCATQGTIICVTVVDNIKCIPKKFFYFSFKATTQQVLL